MKFFKSFLYVFYTFFDASQPFGNTCISRIYIVDIFFHSINTGLYVRNIGHYRTFTFPGYSIIVAFISSKT